MYRRYFCARPRAARSSHILSDASDTICIPERFSKPSIQKTGEAFFSNCIQPYVSNMACIGLPQLSDYAFFHGPKITPNLNKNYCHCVSSEAPNSCDKYVSITTAWKTMFLVLLVCLSVRRITLKVMNGCT